MLGDAGAVTSQLKFICFTSTLASKDARGRVMLTVPGVCPLRTVALSRGQGTQWNCMCPGTGRLRPRLLLLLGPVAQSQSPNLPAEREGTGMPESMCQDLEMLPASQRMARTLPVLLHSRLLAASVCQRVSPASPVTATATAAVTYFKPSGDRMPSFPPAAWGTQSSGLSRQPVLLVSRTRP